MSFGDKVAVWGLAVALLTLAISIGFATFAYLRGQYPAMRLLRLYPFTFGFRDDGDEENDLEAEVLNCGAPAYDVAVALSIETKDGQRALVYFSKNYFNDREFRCGVIERGQQETFYLTADHFRSIVTSPYTFSGLADALKGRSEEEIISRTEIHIIGSGRTLKVIKGSKCLPRPLPFRMSLPAEPVARRTA